MFIGESVKMFEGSQGRSLSRSQNSVLHDHEGMFIRSLFELQKRPVFSQLAFESEIDKIRTCVAKVCLTQDKIIRSTFLYLGAPSYMTKGFTLGNLLKPTSRVAISRADSSRRREGG